MPIKPRKLRDTLISKLGFEEDSTKSTDHYWYKLELIDVEPVVTKVSHSNKEIGKVLQGKIARQLKVNSKYLDGLVGCSRTRDQYYQRLRDG